MADPSVIAPVQVATPSFSGSGSTSFQTPSRHQFTPRSHHDHSGGHSTFYRPRHHKFQPRFPPVGGGDDASGISYDGKRMRKAIHRKTVDYNPSVFKYLQNRIWQRDRRDEHLIQPDSLYIPDLLPPSAMIEKPMNCVTTRFVRTSTNKFRCPIFCLSWTPEGRRLVTGASSGEFTLWNGLTFNFETILQAHETAVRAMRWSHSDTWMVTADHAGYIKYWQSNMNNVKMYPGHKEPIRGISFCPSDNKFASCSDDGTVRVWDFMRCQEERILRGHGADVRCVDWHPQKGLIASGSKDNQQPIKLWEPRSGTSLATIHAHKHTVMDLKWHHNGNWMLTASRDHLVKLFDVRNLKEELQTFKGHKREATAISWHPIHESLFASGSADGALMFWMVGCDHEVGSMEEAHEGMVWDLSWHPLGHILASGSNDHTTKFWTRNRPGDEMRDKYNLNNLPQGMMETEILEYHSEPLAMPTLPGMGLEHGLPEHLLKDEDIKTENELPAIPGLDWEADEAYLKAEERAAQKKVPYARPVPKFFEQAWSGEIDIETIKKEQQESKAKQQHHQQKMQANFLRPNQPALLLAQQVIGAAIAGTLRHSLSISEAARMLIPGAPVLMRPNAPRMILAPGQSMVGQPQGRMFVMPGMPRGGGTPNQQQPPPSSNTPSSQDPGASSSGNSQANSNNGTGISSTASADAANFLAGMASQLQQQQQQQQQKQHRQQEQGSFSNQRSVPAHGNPSNSVTGMPAVSQGQPSLQRPPRPQGQMGSFSNQPIIMPGFSPQERMVRPQGQMGGLPQGQMSGPPQGQMGGLPQGQMSGPPPPQGQMSGPPQGQMSGPPQGQMSGPPQGQMSGPPQGQMSGPPQGQMSGPPQGQMSGPPQSQMSGPPKGQMGGPPQGQVGGPPQGHQYQSSGPPNMNSMPPNNHGGQGGGHQAQGRGPPPSGQYGGPQVQMGKRPPSLGTNKDQFGDTQRGPPQFNAPARGKPGDGQRHGSHDFGTSHQGHDSGQDYGIDQDFDKDERMQPQRNAPSAMRMSSGGGQGDQTKDANQEYDNRRQDSVAMGDYDYRQPPMGRNKMEPARQGPNRLAAPQQRYHDQGGARNHDGSQGKFREGGGGYGGHKEGEEYQEEWGNDGGDCDYRQPGRGRGEERRRGGGSGGWHSQPRGGGFNRGGGWEEEHNNYEFEEADKYDGGGGGGGYEDQDERGDSRGGRGRKRAWEEGPGESPRGGRGGRSRGTWGGGRGGRGESRGHMGFRGGNRGPGRGVRGGGGGRGGRGMERGRGRGGY